MFGLLCLVIRPAVCSLIIFAEVATPGLEKRAMIQEIPRFLVLTRRRWMRPVQRLMVNGEVIIVQKTVLSVVRGQLKIDNAAAIAEDALMTAILIQFTIVLIVVPVIAKAGAMIATAWYASAAASGMIKGAQRVLAITIPLPKQRQKKHVLMAAMTERAKLRLGRLLAVLKTNAVKSNVVRTMLTGPAVMPPGRLGALIVKAAGTF